MSNTFKIKTLFWVCLFTVFQVKANTRSISSEYPDMEKIEWSNTLALPEINGKANIGIAGAFSGFIGSNLLVGGGANFPDATPWNGGHKTWWNVYLEH